MNCPACDGRLYKTSLYQMNLDLCPDCHGIWFDKGIFKKVADKIEVIGKPALRLKMRTFCLCQGR